MASGSHARTIDLNADLGEGFPERPGAGSDRVTSASVACGAHAGDRDGIWRQRSSGARAGASPSVPIPATPIASGFGRREPTMPPEAVAPSILEQVEHVRAELAAEAGSRSGSSSRTVALYNQAQRQADVARGRGGRGWRRWRLPLLGQPEPRLERLCPGRGVRYVTEGFPDRRYRDDGRLVPRSEPDAMLHDPAEMESPGPAAGRAGRGDALHPRR